MDEFGRKIGRICDQFGRRCDESFLFSPRFCRRHALSVPTNYRPRGELQRIRSHRPLLNGLCKEVLTNRVLVTFNLATPQGADLFSNLPGITHVACAEGLSMSERFRGLLLYLLVRDWLGE